MKSKLDKIDALLEMPCYIIDFLPEQVKQDSQGQYRYVEYYLLNSEKRHTLKDRMVNVILKLMCYYQVSILWNGWQEQPLPSVLEGAISEIMDNHSGTLNILLEEVDTLVVFEWDCLNLSIYNPPQSVQLLLEKLAFSEGLFWRKSPFQHGF